MPTGLKNGAGTDLDDVFEPYQSGTKPATTGFKAPDGTDLRERYAPLSLGIAAAITGLKIASGADLNTLWAAKGSVAYTLGFHGSNYGANASALSGQTGPIGSQMGLNLDANGNWYAAGGPNPTGSPTTGSWRPSGASSAYQVKFTVAGGAPPHFNGAPDWSSLSTTRGVSVSAQVEASTTDTQLASIGVRCQVRRVSDGVILTDSTCTISAYAQGQV